MECIDLVQVSAETLAPKASQAVRWMRSLPAPHDIVLGPSGNGRARHVVFKGCRAPLDFVSVFALERYFNKVYPPDCVCFPLLTHNFSSFSPGCCEAPPAVPNHHFELSLIHIIAIRRYLSVHPLNTKSSYDGLFVLYFMSRTIQPLRELDNRKAIPRKGWPKSYTRSLYYRR